MSELEFSNRINLNLSLLSGYATSLTRNHDDAQDLVQETLLKAYVYRDRFAVNYNFKGWLMTIMKNQFLNRYNSLKRKPEQVAIEENEYQMPVRRRVENQGITNMVLEELNHVIDNLDEKYQQPFLLHYRGFRYDEIADRMQLPLGTVKTRIHTARRMLQARIQRQ